MPKFDRNILARFLPNARAISDFEKLNTSVDKELPAAIGTASDLASQAISRVEALAKRMDAAELLPPAVPHQQADDLVPVSVSAGPADDLAPAHYNP